ncbi:hypothetical protein YC2023_025531 [Brassica napus]
MASSSIDTKGAPSTGVPSSPQQLSLSLARQTNHSSRRRRPTSHNNCCTWKKILQRSRKVELRNLFSKTLSFCFKKFLGEQTKCCCFDTNYTSFKNELNAVFYSEMGQKRKVLSSRKNLKNRAMKRRARGATLQGDGNWEKVNHFVEYESEWRYRLVFSAIGEILYGHSFVIILALSVSVCHRNADIADGRVIIQKVVAYHLAQHGMAYLIVNHNTHRAAKTGCYYTSKTRRFWNISIANSS